MIARISHRLQLQYSQLTIPIFVHHHDGEQHAQCEEEDSVNVVRDGVADLDAESEEKNTADNVKRHAENDISNNPSIVQCPHYEHELRHSIDKSTNGGEEEVGDEETDGLCV